MSMMSNYRAKLRRERKARWMEKKRRLLKAKFRTPEKADELEKAQEKAKADAAR